MRAALADLMRGRTVVAIAHRLSTVRSFDRIVVLQGGGVVQDGAPGELARQPGPYRGSVALPGARARCGGVTPPAPNVSDDPAATALCTVFPAL